MTDVRVAIAVGTVLLLTGCGHRAAPDPGGLTPEDSQLENNAAAMLDDNGMAPADPGS